MAKRKRLTPAKTEFLTQIEGLETRSAPFSPAPIAQVAGDASATAALAELTQMVSDARAAGRLIQSIPLEDIDLTYLVRDRIVADPEELQVLVSSIRERGQQSPVEVIDCGGDASPRYGLISGWRRITALKLLSAEDQKFGKVQALVRSPETSSDAYVAMIEENEIRVGLSFYERARIVVKAMEEGVYPNTKLALQSLYKNVSRAKRSKIKSFMTVVEVLDGVLKFPSHIGERLGLEMAQHCAEHGGAVLHDAVDHTSYETAAEEQDLLRAALASSKVKPEPKPQETGAKFDPKSSKITISGADESLFNALTEWLSKR